MNTKITENRKVRGYKAEFVIWMEKQKVSFNVEFQVTRCELMQKYVIDFDKETSSVYTQKVNSEFNLNWLLMDY